MSTKGGLEKKTVESFKRNLITLKNGNEENHSSRLYPLKLAANLMKSGVKTE
jgi:hypothetical protein